MNLYSKRAGEGDALLLLHGLFGSLENLGTLARAFSDQYCVYSLDLPNHGRSEHSVHMSLPLLAESILAWMDEHELERLSIVGHSLGGKAAMELALRWPQRVNKLVVLDIAPVPYEAHHGAVFAGLLAIEPETLVNRQQAEKVLLEYLQEPSLRGFLLKNLVRDKEGNFTWRMNLPVLHRDYANILKANSSGEFSGPVLFLKGELSGYIGDQHREAIQARFPEAELRIISGTQHWLHAEKPDLVAKTILRFLAV